MPTEEKSDSAAGLEKILDRIPYASGVLRRRLISGFLFSAEIVLFSFFVLSGRSSTGKASISQLDPNLLKNTQFMILTLLVIYAVGAVVDVISDGFVVRGVSVMPAMMGYSSKLLFKFAAGLCWPVLLVTGVVFSTFARTNYELDLARRKGDDPNRADFREELSDEALGFYKNRLQENIQVGLNEPFGGKAEAAQEAVVYLTPDAHKSWMASLRSRNHETSSFLSAAFFGTTACLLLYLFRGPKWPGVLWLYGILWFISYLFLGYLHIVRRSIASMIEFLSFADLVKPVALHGLIIQPNSASEGDDNGSRR